jgi:hypothetical protein
MKFIKSLFTDGEWDGDLVKVMGAALIITGVVGWFLGLDPTVVFLTGAGLAATGKFSKQG